MYFIHSRFILSCFDFKFRKTLALPDKSYHSCIVPGMTLRLRHTKNVRLRHTKNVRLRSGRMGG